MMLLRVRDDRHIRNRSEVRDLEHRLQREYPAFDLFIYWHAITGNYVVAEWVSRDRHHAVELQVLGRRPEFRSSAQWGELQQKILQPLSRKELVDTIRADEQFQIRRNEEQKAELRKANERFARDFKGEGKIQVRGGI